MVRRLRFYALLLPALLLKSCEVPDVRPFTRATTELGTTVDASLRRVVADFDRARAAFGSTDSATAARLHTDAQQLAAAAARFDGVAHAFDAYAQALDAVAAAGQRRDTAVARAAQATRGLVAASKVFLGPVAAVAAPAQAAVRLLDQAASDINQAATIHSLSRLASAPQDTVVQRAARVLRYGLVEFARLDAKATALAALYEQEAGYHTAMEDYYASARQRQQAATPLLAKLVLAQAYLLTGSQPQSLRVLLDSLRRQDPDPQRLLAKASLRQPSQLLAALHQRELFYRDLVVLPQAQYDAEQTAYQYRHPAADQLLRQSAQLISTWADSHHALLHLLARARHATPPDVTRYTQATQKLLDDLHALQQ